MSYELRGLKSLQAGLKDRVKLEAAKKVVKTHTTRMQQNAMRKAPDVYVKGYSTGTTKKSIALDMEDEGLTGRVALTQDYDEYVEYGTRFMAAEPLLGPVFKDEKGDFVSDLKKEMK